MKENIAENLLEIKAVALSQMNRLHGRPVLFHRFIVIIV